MKGRTRETGGCEAAGSGCGMGGIEGAGLEAREASGCWVGGDGRSEAGRGKAGSEKEGAGREGGEARIWANWSPQLWNES